MPKQLHWSITFTEDFQAHIVCQVDREGNCKLNQTYRSLVNSDPT